MTEDCAQEWAKGSLTEAEKDQIRALLLDAMAGEFFQPLNRIALNREYLQMHLEREREHYDVDKVSEALECIDTATAELNRLMNNCLDLMTCLQGRMRPQIVAVDLGALVADIAAASAEGAATLGVRIAFAPPEKEICVETDRLMAERIVLNLLSNAMRATAPGGKITLALKNTAGECCFSIKDEGRGVSSEFAAQAFHSALREHGPSKERALGRAGVGLYLCEEFCRLLGWHPEMHAGKRGTIVTVTIPAEQLASGRFLVFHSAPEEAQRRREETYADVLQELRSLPGLEKLGK